MEECITISTRKGLSDIGDIGETRYCFDELEFSDFSLLHQSLLEFERCIKMILDRLLASSCHYHDICDPSSNCLLYEILDHWFVYDGEHLFGLSLGCREKSSTESSGWDDTLADSGHKREAD
jgi:hypothetical protein